MKWIAFPLHPEVPPQGVTPEELFNTNPINMEAAFARFQRTADELGLPWGPRHKIYNTRRAAELGKWAEEMGRSDAYHEAVFKAYFAEALDISDRTILETICQDLGLDGAEAERVLDQNTHQEAVDRDWRYSKEMSVMAVPTFMASGRSVVGAQPYEVLENLVIQASDQGAGPRPPLPMV